jgi:hypothetical protein
MTVKVQDSSHGLSDHADTSQGYCALAMVARGTGSFHRFRKGGLEFWLEQAIDFLPGDRPAF